ncbi:prion-inhibition and propagation-domain-containing protein [Halenospora varia]|nr:prion-inhibition and propagation-domain-containing protein [Halenospora varia]
MDPITAAGIALSVAALAGQVFSGCIQGIQFIVTAKNLPEESKYLNLRLRMEQQRLFAWSETSGLMDHQNEKDQKIRESNTFVIHRTTILDLLVQIQCLFQEFEKAQIKNEYLKVVQEPVEQDEELINDPAKDSSSAHVPLTESRRSFIIKAMKDMRNKTTQVLSTGRKRLKWAAFDKDAFENLLQRFATLNDNMTDILDAQLQTEIYRTTQDTNRGVLQLHKDLNSLHRLVKALDIKMQAQAYPVPTIPQYTPDASGLQLLAQLARFKAFNESLDTKAPWDEATALILQLGQPDAEKSNTKIDKSKIILNPQGSSPDLSELRSEALYDNGGSVQRVWIEWKEYDYQSPGSLSPPPLIVDRVQRLASLLHHTPKPDAFRVPHCLGYFDNGPPDTDGGGENDEDGVEPRIGFVFEKPKDKGVSPETPPISLFDLLQTRPKPRVTERIRLAHAIANCLLYLHSVNWLHKGLRSHNIVFFPSTTGDTYGSSQKIEYSKPYLSGFDFARPARADEMTEIPGDVPAYNLYRHPSTQGQGFGPRESFRKSFDIYSLGVVLVELAHWATIDKILNLDMKRMRTTTKIKAMLLQERQVNEIGANMGEIYETATLKCLAGGPQLGIEDNEDETNDTIAAKLSMAFYEDVVKKLGDVKV